MRILVLLTLLCLLPACTDGDSSSASKLRPGSETIYSPEAFLIVGPESIPYTPVKFRSDVERLISNKQYSGAVSYLASAAPEIQTKYDSDGYLAVALDMILLPGVYPDIDYSSDRDWVFPGTSDVIESDGWQDAATAFAEQYNRFRRGGD